jgi:uncharacterized protein YbjT (DUF2867 family)
VIGTEDEKMVRMVDVLVAGAAGNTGRPLVEELHRAGVSVRAMVRRRDDAVPGDPEKVVADFNDADSVRTALRGARRAYLVTPSSERAEATAAQLHRRRPTGRSRAAGAAFSA